MLDAIEREEWFQSYLEEALKLDAHFMEAISWARSMSLIAEQFVDNDDRELVD